MKAQIILAGIALTAVALLGFNYRNPVEPPPGEEYATATVYSSGLFVRTVNGKTEVITLEGEKLAGLNGKWYKSSCIQELNKISQDGYEMVNVSVSEAGSLMYELYLFRKVK